MNWENGSSLHYSWVHIAFSRERICQEIQTSQVSTISNSSQQLLAFFFFQLMNCYSNGLRSLAFPARKSRFQRLAWLPTQEVPYFLHRCGVGHLQRRVEVIWHCSKQMAWSRGPRLLLAGRHILHVFFSCLIGPSYTAHSSWFSSPWFLIAFKFLMPGLPDNTINDLFANVPLQAEEIPARSWMESLQPDKLPTALFSCMKKVSAPFEHFHRHIEGHQYHSHGQGLN